MQVVVPVSEGPPSRGQDEALLSQGSKLKLSDLEAVFQQTPYLDSNVDSEAAVTMMYLTIHCGLQPKAIRVLICSVLVSAWNFTELSLVGQTMFYCTTSPIISN